jgi:hypothetical protein
MNKVKIMACVLFLGSSISLAQNKQMRFDHLTTAQGLSDNTKYLK